MLTIKEILRVQKMRRTYGDFDCHTKSTIPRRSSVIATPDTPKKFIVKHKGKLKSK